MHSQPFSFLDEQNSDPRKTDAAAMRILARYVAAHDGFTPQVDAIIDRDFVIVEPTTRDGRMRAHVRHVR